VIKDLVPGQKRL